MKRLLFLFVLVAGGRAGALLDLGNDLEDAEKHFQEGDDQIVDVLDVVKLIEGFHHLDLFRSGGAIFFKDLESPFLGFGFGLQSHDGEDEADHIEEQADASRDHRDDAAELEKDDVDDGADGDDRDEGDRAEVDERSQDDPGLHVFVAFLIEDGEGGFLSAHGKRGNRRLLDGPSAEADFLEVMGIAVPEEEGAHRGNADVLQSIVVEDLPRRIAAIEAGFVHRPVIDDVFDEENQLDDSGEDRHHDDQRADDYHGPEDDRANVFEALNINKCHK